MITRARACSIKKGTSSTLLPSPAPATKPRTTPKRITKPKAKPASKPKAKPKTPAADMCLLGKSPEMKTIEAAARKAAENHMHLNIHKFTPTINQAVRISVTHALDEAIPKIVQQVVREIETKQTSPLIANQRGTHQAITASEVQSVKAAVPSVVWLKCPLGHQYAVGECGKPAVQGKCIECKAQLY
ncbi:hypothetical protein IW152_002595 [Coemansia sp. BCRC 34962]|nr:hypothetical protein IW152_002595 [Coemansia sp. BCRC 34962]